MIQPTLRPYLEKRSGLVGSLRQQEEETPSNSSSLGTGGRDLKAQPNKGTKGRIGDKRKGGRIWGPSSGPGPMDQYLERENRTLPSKDATTRTLGRSQRQQQETGERETKDRTSLEEDWGEKKEEKIEPSTRKERGSRDQLPP